MLMSCSSVTLPLKAAWLSANGEDPDVTFILAQRSPGNGAPNFKGLPPIRKESDRVH